MFSGLDIQLDFALYEDEKETKKKARILKKKGGKPLGGKLFKMTAQNNKKEQTKIKQEMKLKGSAGEDQDGGMGAEMIGRGGGVRTGGGHQLGGADGGGSGVGKLMAVGAGGPGGEGAKKDKGGAGLEGEDMKVMDAVGSKIKA